MPKFNYVAASNSDKSKTISGTLDAPDEAAVVATLKKQRMQPLRITLAGGKSSSLGGLFGGGKVKTDHLVIFTRQLSAMVGAGVPLLRSLNSLEQHAESPALKSILVSVIKDVEGGAPLADALEKHPNTFSDVYVNMVRAGESAGILDDILKRLALQQEKNASIRKKVKSAMAYPMVLMVITVLAFFGLMLFVIPQIGKILLDLGGPDAELPLLTQAMLGISAFSLQWWYILIPALIGGVFLLLRYIKTPVGKRQFHGLVLKLPAVSTIIKKVVIARFARTFSSLNGAGVSILETLTVTSRALGNVIYEEALLEAIDKVKNGQQLSQVLEQNDLFPAIVPQMLAVGEETGQTDVVLLKVADFFEEEVDSAINSLSSIIEPVMIVIMGAAVGLIAASVMGPIASLSQNIQ